MFQNTDIIITTNNFKKELLKNTNKELLNIKIYSLNEFNRLFYYDYNEESIIYIMKKYNVIYEIAKIYLNNLIYIEDKNYHSEKLNFLSSLKKELLDNKLLYVNKLFKEHLKNKKIIIYNLPDTKEINKIKVELNAEVINDRENKNSNHQIHEFNNIEEEVVYVADSICELIKDGIDAKKIFLTNLNDEYYKLIRRIFPMYNIPFTINDNDSIYGTYLSNKFLELYDDDISKTITNLKEYVDSEETENIYNQILNIVNNYAFIENYSEVLPMIKHDLKNTKLKKKDLINSVHEANIDDVYNDDEYVFLLSFNQGIIPHIFKDEDYLSDKEKEELNISTTLDKNKQERQKTITCLSNIKNLNISYKLNANDDKFTISNLLDEPKIIKDEHTSYSYSNLFNKIKLTSLKDEYNKYGTVSDSLYALNSTYEDLPYKKYNHDFKGIDKKDYHEYLNNQIVLSYSKIDEYYKCPFHYYLDSILKLNNGEDTFSIKIGNVFHYVLEKFNTYKGSYDKLWNEAISNYEFNNQELFFLEKLHDELLFVIDTIKEQENYTEFHNELHEEKIFTSISGDIKITFMGVIDKLKYTKEDGKTIIAIIDYKTGTPSLDLTTIPHGIGMQLPVYLYLAKNSKLSNVEVAGFYLHHILNNEMSVDLDESYEELKKKELLLQGYSNEDEQILSKWDNTYENSKLIKNMRKNKNGTFYSHANTLSKEQMDKLTNIAEEKIKEAAKLITEANFPIAPKKIEKINYGCRYCKYRDICYHTPDDIVELEKKTKEEVLGGDE